jgi:antitoxin (DNA-binding transcriptional repressor) of toxin-antitoxin stability system
MVKKSLRRRRRKFWTEDINIIVPVCFPLVPSVRRHYADACDARETLPALIKRAEGGERVTICRRGEPVADLVRSEQPGRKRRKLGTLAGRTKNILQQ